MKILIDENLPIKLKLKLPDYQVFTVRDMQWNSIKNGQLLKLAIEHNFEVFITTDKNLEYQQNIKKMPLTLIVIDVYLLKWSMIEPLIPQIMNILPTVEKGKVYNLKND